ncbi:endonuclease/exonuclease/phosphatase family protein [Paraglaciecola sp.]|uniref:endonuclease/exonuclease/phosphatase family protein n=1 Tax=Paraglaciecola sp. TaxID=1920173 RepID=UPI00273E3A48|nr:endonuclease/exonuclease/phosphatase family protein [Paraglaciecola sp.]MDP5030674.1 endonuclease/exonuclease/phosphatase family protein [Paraglaciecola sp.]
MSQTLRIATFNVSMEASNYLPKGTRPVGNELFERLASGDNSQIKNIAEIIQIIRADIILLNEFDYTQAADIGVEAFIKNYLNVAQQNNQAIDYPYYYTAPVNTGVDSGLDLDKDGIASGLGSDAFGFGLYPGQYGMLILSRFPIETKRIRTFQHFLWKDMPNSLLASIKDEQGKAWFSDEAQQVLRLSSKSHWDVPVSVDGQTLHVLASHPTPPVFDGFEDRNGKRNHDEIRFWFDYINGDERAAYIYDDVGRSGGLDATSFVIVGDLNASAVEGDGIKSGIGSLLASELINSSTIPKSEGAAQLRPQNGHGESHTAEWGMRADYVLPSANLKIIDSGVFWPVSTELTFRLIKDRQASSDHRLVWVDIHLP